MASSPGPHFAVVTGKVAPFMAALVLGCPGASCEVAKVRAQRWLGLQAEHVGRGEQG